jgi:hypothetical protein
MSMEDTLRAVEQAERDGAGSAKRWAAAQHIAHFGGPTGGTIATEAELEKAVRELLSYRGRKPRALIEYAGSEEYRFIRVWVANVTDVNAVWLGSRDRLATSIRLDVEEMGLWKWLTVWDVRWRGKRNG